MDEVIDQVTFYKSGLRRQWRWRYSAAGNHEKMANGGESYVDLIDCMDAACRVLGVDLAAMKWDVVDRPNGTKVEVVIEP